MFTRLGASITAFAITGWFVPLGRADAVFSLTPSTLSLSPGGKVEFTGTLANTGGTQIFLNGDVGLLPYVQLTLDDSPFFANAPLSLLPGASYMGPFFDVMADPATLPGLYKGSFTIQGGADSNAFDNLASQDFNVNVLSVSAIPEPNSFLLMMIGLALTMAVKRLRPQRLTSRLAGR